VVVVVVAGAGMLTGGVAGSVFASPPTSSILEAIRALAAHNPGKIIHLFLTKINSYSSYF
jgi:dihydroxyacetone kinase